MQQIAQRLLPSALLSLTILGLSIIYNGGLIEMEWGPNSRLRIEGVTPKHQEL